MTTVSPSIIAAAQSAMSDWRVPASVSIAQFALESCWGAHMPGNNPFGIKHLVGHGDQHFMTHEVVNGKRITCEQTFAVFTSLADAFTCHAQLIATHAAYASAMKALPDLPRFVSLLAARYATDPSYAAKIMSIIRAHNLTQYDRAS